MKIRLSGWEEDAMAASPEVVLRGEAHKDGGAAGDVDGSGSWDEVQWPDWVL